MTEVELAELHASHGVGDLVRIDSDIDDSAVEGAGFELVTRAPLTLRRLRTLPDWVAPDMRLLLCGLNPSPYSADAGVNFARPATASGRRCSPPAS